MERVLADLVAAGDVNSVPSTIAPALDPVRANVLISAADMRTYAAANHMTPQRTLRAFTLGVHSRKRVRIMLSGERVVSSVQIRRKRPKY